MVIFVHLKSKKNVIVAEAPSAVFHYSESPCDETGASRKTDSIFRAAKKDLLTLMKLDVSMLAQRRGGSQLLTFLSYLLCRASITGDGACRGPSGCFLACPCLVPWCPPSPRTTSSRESCLWVSLG
jgi:hypothetical protein